MAEHDRAGGQRVRGGVGNHQHGEVGVGEHRVGDAPKERPAHAGAPVRPDDDQARPVTCRGLHDRSPGLALLLDRQWEGAEARGASQLRALLRPFLGRLGVELIDLLHGLGQRAGPGPMVPRNTTWDMPAHEWHTRARPPMESARRRGDRSGRALGAVVAKEDRCGVAVFAHEAEPACSRTARWGITITGRSADAEARAHRAERRAQLAEAVGAHRDLVGVVLVRHLHDPLRGIAAHELQLVVHVHERVPALEQEGVEHGLAPLRVVLGFVGGIRGSYQSIGPLKQWTTYTVPDRPARSAAQATAARAVSEPS